VKSEGEVEGIIDYDDAQIITAHRIGMDGVELEEPRVDLLDCGDGRVAQRGGTLAEPGARGAAAYSFPGGRASNCQRRTSRAHGFRGLIPI
jgi:hypothetical protein